MADINLTCSKCSTTIAVSEFANGRIPCPHCGTMLDKTATKLAVLRPQLAPPESRSVPATPPPTKLTPAQRPAKTSSHNRISSGPRLWLRTVAAWVLFAALLAGLLAWQWRGLQDDRFLQNYLTTRWVLAAVAWLAVLIPAFCDSWFQGILCLLIPPYTFYYALDRLDYFALRAFYFAVLFALAAEFYFMPTNTLVSIAQAQLNEWVLYVRQLIANAGRQVDVH